VISDVRHSAAAGVSPFAGVKDCAHVLASGLVTIFVVFRKSIAIQAWHWMSARRIFALAGQDNLNFRAIPNEQV
jgi:hypothetical protein